jgi:hypothetical protein
MVWAPFSGFDATQCVQRCAASRQDGVWFPSGLAARGARSAPPPTEGAMPRLGQRRAAHHVPGATHSSHAPRPIADFMVIGLANPTQSQPKPDDSRGRGRHTACNVAATAGQPPNRPPAHSAASTS